METVGDAMVRRPKTLPADATIADARSALENDHVHLLLLVSDEGALVGTVAREDLEDREGREGREGREELVPGDGPLASIAVLEGRTVEASMPLERAHAMMGTTWRRLAVVAEGRLVGLLCLKRSRAGYCTDEGIEDRARERGLVSR